MPAPRKYEKTHPWLTFRLDLTRAPMQLWFQLGEAVASCEHIAHAPVRPAISTEMHKVFFAKGVLATTAIEGNTLSEEQVRAQLDGALKLPPSKAYLQRETQNVIDACNQIWDQIADDSHPDPKLTPELIKNYNRQVLAGLEGHLEDGVVPGVIPDHNVTVGSYLGAPRQDCDHLLQRLAAWIEELGSSELFPAIGGSSRVSMAILQAIVAHLYLAWIHPFGDGNGRTARLLEFLILARAGVPTPVAHLLSNHYNETRAEYYRQLDRASKSGGDIMPFVQYAVQGLVDGLRGQLQFIRTEHLRAAWESYVFDRFRTVRRTEATARQRDLVLDLSQAAKPVPKRAIRALSPRIAQHYGAKTDKAVTRDLNALRKLGLIDQTSKGVRAKTEIMLGFTPYHRLPEHAA